MTRAPDAAEAIAVARRVCAEAAALVLGASSPGQIASKSNPRDLVTEWDTRLEALIRARFAELTPGVPIVGEEEGGAATGERWLIDPIDGTVNFAHGLPLWAVTVAFEQGGRPIAGVVHAPVLGWEMWAARGGGAFLDPGLGVGAPMRVSRAATLEQSILSTGFPYDRAETRHNFAEWDHLQTVAGACRRLGAASLDLALVARGSLDGYWESRLNAWDVAAGALLVEEAGGQVTDLTGGPFSSDAGEAIATNGLIHAELCAELAKVGGIVARRG